MPDEPACGPRKCTWRTPAWLCLVAGALVGAIFVHYTIIRPPDRKRFGDPAGVVNRAMRAATALSQPSDDTLVAALQGGPMPVETWAGDPGGFAPPANSLRLRGYRRVAMGFHEQFATYRATASVDDVAAHYLARAAERLDLASDQRQGPKRTLFFTRGRRRLVLVLAADPADPAATLVRMQFLNPLVP